MPTERPRPAIPGGDAKPADELWAIRPPMLVGSGVGVSEADCQVAGAGGKAKKLAGCSSSIASGVARFCDPGSMTIPSPGIDITSPSMGARGADLVRMEPDRVDMMRNEKTSRGFAVWIR